MANQDETVFVNYEKSGQDPSGAGMAPRGAGGGAGSLTGRADRPAGKNLSRELERAYLELGKAYYEGGFEDPLPQLLPLFDKITRLRKEEERQKGLCPGCGSPVGENALFCGKCGYRLKGGN